MSTANNFFEDVFLSSFEKMNVFGEMAKDVLNFSVTELLKEESINYDVLKVCLDDFFAHHQYAPKHIIIEGVTGVSVGLINVLKSFDNLRISVLSLSYTGKSFYGFPVVTTIDSEHISLNMVFSTSKMRSKYLTLLEEHRNNLEKKLCSDVVLERSLIVFAAKKVYFNQLRLSKVLRDCGYKTAAVVFDYNMLQHQNGYFDEIIYADLLSFLLLLNKVDKRMLLHTQGWLFRYHIPVLIDIYKSTYCKQIIEIMDSQSFYLPESTVSMIPDSMKVAWGDNVIENHKLQLACEDYIVHHSDGVIFNGDDNYREPLVKCDSQYLRNKHLSFPALPVKDFFYVSNVVNKNKKLVFMGGIPPFLSNRPHELFGDSQLLNLVKNLINRGCYLDIYNNPLIAAEDDYTKLYPDFIRLAAESDRFNFFMGDMPQLINEKISRYDFGLMVYDFCGTYSGDLHFKHLIPTKLFNYLEAGLPVLVSDRFKAVCSIVKEYGIGVIVNQKEIDYIPEIIETIDVAELKKNVITAREELQMHNNIHRLTFFYERVMA